MVKDWIEEMGITWWAGFGGGVAIARRLVKGQTVKRLPSMVGWEGMFVVKRMLRKGKIRYFLNQLAMILNTKSWPRSCCFCQSMKRHRGFVNGKIKWGIGRGRFTSRRWLHSMLPLERPYQKAQRLALRLEPFRPRFGALYLPSSHVDVLARQRVFTLYHEIIYRLGTAVNTMEARHPKCRYWMEVTKSERKERSRGV